MKKSIWGIPSNEQKLEHFIIYFNYPKSEEISMSDFIIVPQNNADNLNRGSLQTRDGDWVCFKCNNLNFSFRKRCNRCKVQTRDQNDQDLLYVYRYYSQFYQSQPQTIVEDYKLDTKRSLSEETQYSDQNSSQEDDIKIDNFLDQKDYNQINLPSVSPITRKYKSEKKDLDLFESNNKMTNEKQYSETRQFLTEYCWNNILIDQQVEAQMLGQNGWQLKDMELEKLVQNIVV